MADATKDDLTFDPDPTVLTVEVDSPFDGVTDQILVNGIREYEEELNNLDKSIIIIAEGKSIITPAVEFTGITLTVINGWTLSFAPRGGPGTESMVIKSGNTLGEAGGNPLTPTAFTQVQIRQSQAPTIINAAVGDFWDALRVAHVIGGSFGEGVPVQTINTDAIDATAIADSGAEKIADAFLLRNIASGSNGGRTVRSAFRKIRNRVFISGGTMTVTEEDDSTVDHTYAITTAAGNPITEQDPA